MGSVCADKSCRVCGGGFAAGFGCFGLAERSCGSNQSVTPLSPASREALGLVISVL